MKQESKMLPGVFRAQKKDGTIYYRSSITFQNKHISLGSYSDELQAHQAYLLARSLTDDKTFTLTDYHKDSILNFEKWVVLLNFRDNKMYFKTPIYLLPKYFLYYLDSKTELKFDVDDLFYYSTHKIMRRNGHLFVADYGMQVTILSRYGIRPHAVKGKDYIFVNGDEWDFRYTNIKIINRYNGVSSHTQNGRVIYTAKIHIHGDFVIGHFKNAASAAIAYNKAADYLSEHGCKKQFAKNYVEDFSSAEYMNEYDKITLPKKIRDYIF